MKKKPGKPVKRKPVTEAEAVKLAQAIASGEFRRRIPKDVSCAYSAEQWVYIVQHASIALAQIALGILSSAIYDKIKAARKKEEEPTITDLYTREIIGNVVKYKRAVNALRKYRRNHKSSRKAIDIYIHDCGRVEKLLDGENADDINLIELLEAYKSDKRRKKKA